MKDQAWQYLLVAGGVLAGTLARVGQWRKEDDTVDWWKAVGELASMPAIVYLVAGGIANFAPMIDPPVAAAIATGIALVGIATVEAVVLRILNRKADGV